MDNDKFWNECRTGSLREKIAIFIDKNGIISDLKGEEYYQLEDELVNLIRENRKLIYDEVDREYRRENVVNYMKNVLCYPAEVVDSFPVELIDKIIDDWMYYLDDNEELFEDERQSLQDAIQDRNLWFSTSEYEDEEIKLYAAYVNDWFKNHDESMCMVCIQEFFDCEMQDEELKEYYEGIAEKIFGGK